MHPNQIPLEEKASPSAEEVFANGSPGASAEVDADKLHAKIGQLSMENDFLSKALGRDR